MTDHQEMTGHQEIEALRGMHFCCFSGAVVDLKGSQRTADNVLAKLRSDPKISTWDMSENYKWLPGIVKQLEDEGKIVAVKSAFPWHRYEVNAND